MRTIVLDINFRQHMFPCAECARKRYLETEKNFKDGGVEIYWSYDEAKEAGWVRTILPEFCPPDKEFVWVCPDCWKDASDFTKAEHFIYKRKSS